MCRMHSSLQFTGKFWMVEAGYKYIFGIMIGLALVGFILAFIFDKTNKKKKVVKSTGKQDDIAQPARS